MARIGVFVCWCGRNIAGTVDVEAAAEILGRHPGVAHSVSYTYMCSDPGQKMLQEAIREQNLTGVVVAACSPQLHEVTFRNASDKAGINPYMCEMANIREQCSWVHSETPATTEKAIDLARATIEKAKHNRPLTPGKIPVNRRAMVIGGGIAGMQAALDVARGGYEVILVERKPSLGGRLAQLHSTFPRMENVHYLTRPKRAQLTHDPRIRVHTNSELEELSGYVGNFKARIKQQPMYVDWQKCDLCAKCFDVCPVEITDRTGHTIGSRKAIFVPSGNGGAGKPVVDAERCLHFGDEGCTKCIEVCEPQRAIDFQMQEQSIEEEVGAVIAATGYDMYPLESVSEHGGGVYENVFTSLQFEQLLRPSAGPELRRPSDGKVPKEVVFVQCVRSRDPERGMPYCSKICCMYTAKQAMLYKQRVPDGQAYVFYTDIRVSGKEYEDFIRCAQEEYGVVYLRGRVSKVFPRGDDVVVWGADTLSGRSVEIEADAVVLSTALVPSKGSKQLAKRLGISYDQHGFFTEAHPKLRPVETNTAGIFLAGACQAPRDIADSVAQASGAASKVLGLFSADELEREPEIASVNEGYCVACFDCEKVCPYRAITAKEIRDRKGVLVKMVASINPGLCQGCGACAATCRSKSIDLDGFTEEQIFAEIAAL